MYLSVCYSFLIFLFLFSFFFFCRQIIICICCQLTTAVAVTASAAAPVSTATTTTKKKETEELATVTVAVTAMLYKKIFYKYFCSNRVFFSEITFIEHQKRSVFLFFFFCSFSNTTDQKHLKYTQTHKLTLSLCCLLENNNEEFKVCNVSSA